MEGVTRKNDLMLKDYSNNLLQQFITISNQRDQEKINKLEEKVVKLVKKIGALEKSNQLLAAELDDLKSSSKKLRPSNFDTNTWENVIDGFRTNDKAWTISNCAHCHMEIRHHQKAQRVRDHLSKCAAYKIAIFTESESETDEKK